MPKYELTAKFTLQMARNEKYTCIQTLEFERDTDKAAANYAFDKDTLDASEDEKKLVKILATGSRIRIYNE